MLETEAQNIQFKEGAIVKFSKEELGKMKFGDTFKLQEPDDYEDEDCCIICGNKLENLKIGYNEKEQLYKYECANCGTIFVMTIDSERDERFLLQGEVTVQGG